MSNMAKSVSGSRNFSGCLSTNSVYLGYCGTTLGTAPVLEPDISHAQCNMLCKGNNKEYCGAGSLLNVYEYNSTATARKM